LVTGGDSSHHYIRLNEWSTKDLQPLASLLNDLLLAFALARRRKSNKFWVTFKTLINDQVLAFTSARWRKQLRHLLASTHRMRKQLINRAIYSKLGSSSTVDGLICLDSFSTLASTRLDVHATPQTSFFSLCAIRSASYFSST